MPATIGEVAWDTAKKRACGLGEAHLSSAGPAGDARRDMYRQTGDIGVGDQAFTGVQAASHDKPEIDGLSYEAGCTPHRAARI